MKLNIWVLTSQILKIPTHITPINVLSNRDEEADKFSSTPKYKRIKNQNFKRQFTKKEMNLCVKSFLSHEIQ